MGVGIFCSRILGLVRELVLAGLFGAGRGMDAFFMAFRTPNMLRDLFAEGALSMAFVTTFSKKIEIEGPEAAWRLASKVATLVAVFMSAVCVLGILCAPWIIALIAPGFDADKAALTVLLARIMYPFILLVSLAALVMGMLNARHVFAAPAFASSFFNLSMISVGAGLGWLLDPSFGEKALLGLAAGALVGGLLQLLVQIPSLLKLGYRYRPDFLWRDPGVRQVLTLMAPALVAASAVQVNVLVNSVFASMLGDGPVSWLQYSFRLMQLPLGVFGVAIATVTLPLISRSAARNDIPEFRGTLARGLRLALLLTIPSAVGLACLAEPIISVIYERGRFDAADTVATAAALQFYAIGLVAYSALKVITPAFYALDRKTTPMFVGFFAIASNLLLNWFFTFRLGLGHRGLALSTGLVAVVNFGILYALMHRHLSGIEGGKMLAALGKILLAAAVMAAICQLSLSWRLGSWAGMPFLLKLAWLAGTIAAAVPAFFGLAWLLHVEEVADLFRLLNRKRK